MSDDVTEYRQRFASDLTYYAKHCLKIKTKSGALEPFVFNKAQKYIHDRLEAQKQKTGKVRALIIKGRQMGCSTYVGARFFHRTTHAKAQKCFILTHLAESTSALFDMVHTYAKYLPDMVKPSMGAASSKEIFFDRLESGYKVGTAGSGEVGRGTTIQLFHGSEVAFYPSPEKIASGVMQAVSDLPGTEIILESTANGIGNYFHQRYKSALTDDDPYEVIFVPWFWMDEYTAGVPHDFKATEEEAELCSLYNLSDGQLMWRRNKIRDLPLGLPQFKQEYPCTAQEAFQSSNQNSFIPLEPVIAASKAVIGAALYSNAPLIIGFDPAHEGKDTGVAIARQGRKAWVIETFNGKDGIHTGNRVAQLARELKARCIMIDKIGVGASAYDQLRMHFPLDAYPGMVIGVSSASRDVQEPEKYYNLRVEMWAKMREWFMDKPCQIDDNQQLIEDLVALSGEIASNGYSTKLESKDKLAKSPDYADALALTFAFPVPEQKPQTYYSHVFV